MNKFIKTVALALLASGAVLSVGCDKSDDSALSLVLPADATEISGPDGYYEGEPAEITAPEIEYADTYVWYEGNRVIPGATERTLVVSEEGIYRVAGVNELGEGKASPAKPMRLLTFTDRLTGDWDCTEFWVQPGENEAQDTYQRNPHVITIIRTGELWENKIAIVNFFQANPPGYYSAFAELLVYDGVYYTAKGDTVVATVDEETRTIRIPTGWQFTPSWTLGTTTELCPMIYDSSYADNYGEAFPPQEVTELEDGTLRVNMVVGPLVAYVGSDQTPYPHTYMIATTSSNYGFVRRIANVFGTVWTKRNDNPQNSENE